MNKLDIIEYTASTRLFPYYAQPVQPNICKQSRINPIELIQKTKIKKIAETTNIFKVIYNIKECYLLKPIEYFNEYIIVVLRHATTVDNFDLIYYIYKNLFINDEKTNMLLEIAKKYDAQQIFYFLIDVIENKKMNIRTDNSLFLYEIFKNEYNLKDISLIKTYCLPSFKQQLPIN